MKKFTTLVFVGLIVFSAYAKESVLFSADADASFEEWSYAENFHGETRSGNIKSRDIYRLDKTDKGIRFYVQVPNATFNYEIMPAYPSFINEPNTESGYLDNVGDIKSIKLVCSLNRPYDEIYLLYSTTRTGEVKKIKFAKAFTQVNSMSETEFIYENPTYSDNVRTREISSYPLIGAENDGLYFRGIGVKCNTAPAGYEYSNCSVVYLKSISVIYDLKFDEDTYSMKKELNEEFGLTKDDEVIKNKARDRLRFEKNYYDNEEKKKATESVDNMQDTN